MSRRRSLTATAVAAMSLSIALAGCGREQEQDSGEGAGAGAAVDDSPATGTIEVWAMGTEGEALGDFVADFESENPDAQVEVTAVPWEAAHDKIANAITAGETPDVSLVGTTWMGEFAETDGLDPVPEDLVDESAFFDGAWDTTVVGGTSYGVPWYVDSRVLFYRTDLAEQAGWTEPPATWEELKQFATDLEEKAGVETPLSLQPGQTGSWQTVMPFAWSNGATLTNEEETEYTLDSPEMVEALDFYASFFEEGLSETRLLDPGELETGFAEGRYGAFISGPWHTGLVEDAGLTSDQYGLATIPGKESAPGTSFVGGGDLAVFADSDNRESAWKLVRWLTEPEVQQKWYEDVGGLPAVQAAWESGVLAEDPQLQVFGEQLQNAQAPPAVPTWEQVAEVIDADVERAVKGAASVEEAVADMQSRASAIGTGLQ